MKTKLFIFSAILLFIASCQENTYINSYKVEPPILTDFSPKEGEVGTEIHITGQNLQRVDTVLIGGTLAQIVYRINSEEMVAKVVSGNMTGKILISNISGKDESTEEFTVNYAVPTIKNCPTEGTVNKEIVIEGENLHFVAQVFIGNMTATIVAQRPTELVFKVPYLDEEQSVELSFSYFNGESFVSTDAINFTVMLQAPEISYCPTALTKYQPVTMQGENLKLIDALYVGSEPVLIKIQSDEELTFDMPTNYFGGNMTGNLRAIYYGVKELVLVEDFQVTADPNEPRYYEYKNVLLSAREAYGGTEQSFFDCETGLVISSCDAAESMSIIDFFLYDQAGYVQLYSPNNASNTIKNFKCDGKTIDAQDGTWNKFYDADNGTATLFRVLKPENEAEKAIIDAYEAGTIVELNEEFFAGITEPSSKAPRVYRSAKDDGYSNSHFSLDEYPYGYIRNFTTGKNGIIKVTAMPKDAVGGRIAELQFDIIWSK